MDHDASMRPRVFPAEDTEMFNADQIVRMLQ